MGAAPILAPTLGGFILAFAGWQAIFWVCAIYGAISCVLVILLLPETLPADRRVRLSLAAQLGRYNTILRERGFITRSLMGGCAMFAMFAYLGGSPAVFIDIYHLPPPLYGSLFGCCAAGYIGGSQLNPRLITRFGPDRVMRAAVRLFLGATLLLLVSAFLRLPFWWSIAIPIFMMMSTQGFIMPNATVGALSRHAGHAGSASALMGTMQFCLGAVSGVVVGVATDGTARPMALLIVLGALAANAADLCRVRRVPIPAEQR
jgi:DHA1 family bicyclomycin/chloramphenicol resistance-like MFS transporter